MSIGTGAARISLKKSWPSTIALSHRTVSSERRGFHHSLMSVVTRSATVCTPSGRSSVSSIDARNRRVICSRKRVRIP